MENKERSGTKPLEKRKEKTRRARKITAEYLRKAALFYLDRYNGTRASVQALLWRRIDSAKRAGGEIADKAQLEAWIVALLDRLEELELLDDRRFAVNRAKSLLESGHSLAMVRMKLQQKGVRANDIDYAIDQLLDEESPEELALRAAVAYVRKRRLGCWRASLALQEQNHDRDLAALARRGFSYQIAIKALDLCDKEP